MAIDERRRHFAPTLLPPGALVRRPHAAASSSVTAVTRDPPAPLPSTERCPGKMVGMMCRRPHIAQDPPNPKCQTPTWNASRGVPLSPPPPPPQEVWFSGCHGNIGGGSGCTLSDLTLQWMLEAAARHGLEAAPTAANLEAVEREIDQAWNNWLVRLSGEFRQRIIPEGVCGAHPPAQVGECCRGLCVLC